MSFRKEPDVENVIHAFELRGGENKGLHRLLEKLAKSDKGVNLPTISNAMLILAHDPPLSKMLGYNEFTSQHLILTPPPSIEEGDATLSGPYPRPWGPEDVALVLGYVQRIWCSRMSKQTVEDAMLADAARNRFHPVRNWLASLKWDGKPRIKQWLHKALGCPDDAYHRAIGSKWMIAAVRRIRQPGCKFDHIPVLEGDQGIGKSRVCEALTGREWFSDAIPEDLASRDAALGLLGVWVLEFAEIQHLIRNEVETIKAFLSRSTDRYRPPYGKAYIERPSQGVLIGTTNSTDYLKDSSGNRRIWPVKCKFANVDWIVANRDQLWAEAAELEEAGDPIWLDDTVVREAAADEQESRMSEDVWTDKITQWLQGRVEFRMGDLLSGIGIEFSKQGKREEMRAASVLVAEGWERKARRDRLTKKIIRFWGKKEAEDDLA